MVLLLYGPDTYSSRLYLAQLVAQFKAKVPGGSSAASSLAADAISPTAIRQAGTGGSLLAPRQLLVVEGLFEGRSVAADVAAAVEDLVASQAGDEPTKNVVVFYQAGTPDQRLKLFKLLAEQPRSKLFPEMSPAQAAQLAQRLVATAGSSIAPGTASALAAAVGTDGWAIANAAATLGGYRYGAAVTAEDVARYGSAAAGGSVFDLTDALGGRDGKLATRLLQQLLAAGEEPLYLAAMLARQLRLVALAKDASLAPAQLASRHKIHPFVAGKLVRQADAFTWPRLAAAFRSLARADADLKSAGSANGPAVLQRLVASI